MEWHPTTPEIAPPDGAASLDEAEAIDLVVPTFAELFESGHIGAGRPLMIGYDYDSGQPHQGSWLDLYSCAVAGLQGSGKTTTELWIILQSVLHGARLLVIDPHRDAAQDSLGGRLAPLAAYFVHPVAGDDAHQILAVVKLARREVQRRRRGLTGAPIILVVDEFTRMMRRSSISEETVQLILARLAKLDQLEQALTAPTVPQQQAQTGQVAIGEQIVAVKQLAAPASAPNGSQERQENNMPAQVHDAQNTLENPVSIFRKEGEYADIKPPIYSDKFRSKEQVIADILVRRPEASAEEIANEAGCTVRTATKWMQRLQAPDAEIN